MAGVSEENPFRTQGKKLDVVQSTEVKEAVVIEKLDRWARFKAPNVLLFCFSTVYVIACVLILVIGYPMLLDAADDLKTNAAYAYSDGQKANPCGLPGTDALPLLQAFNRYESGLLTTPLIEPNYVGWIEEVEAALCAADYKWQSQGNDGERCDRGQDASPPPPPFPSNPLNEPTPPPSPGPPPSVPPIAATLECLEDQARELRAIAQLARNWTVTPKSDATTNLITQATIDQAAKELTDNVCQDYENADGHESFYSKRLSTAYGDLKTRVARAYVAAAPSFYRYAALQTANGNKGCLGAHNPFQTNGACANSDHVNYVLQEAGSVASSARLAGVAGEPLPSFQRQVYALLALAVLSNFDRTLNSGACFRNQLLEDEIYNNENAQSFCTDIYAGATFGTSGAANPMVGYATVDAGLAADHSCSWSPAPPSPPNAPPFVRDVFETGLTSTAEGTKAGVVAVCANLLQYGLFDQGRLFGIPDVLRPFAVDVRADASLHFIAHPIYQNLYINVVNGAGDGNEVFHHPATRLEAYLAYRLAALTIWGMLIACVVGFFLVRAVVPMFFQAMRLIGLRNLRGDSIFLTRPKPDFTTFLASLVAFLAGYWTLFVDPAVQSSYPITADCSDWMHGDVHSSSGAYVTSWGKRRFERIGESRIGLALYAMVPLPFVYATVTILLDPRITFWRKQKVVWTPFNPAPFYIVFMLTIVNLLLTAGETVQKGHDWVKATEDDTNEVEKKVERLVNDCRLAVLIAFWSSAANGAVRSRWTVDNLGRNWKILWFAFTVLLVWVPVISYRDLLGTEWDKALANPSHDSGRQWRIAILLISLIVQTGMVIWMFVALYKNAPNEDGTGWAASFAKVQADKAVIKAQTDKKSRFDSLFSRFRAAKNTNASSVDAFDLSAQQLLPTASRFSFKFTDAQFGVPDETGHTTALPAAPLFTGRRHKDDVQYLPMLKFKP